MLVRPIRMNPACRRRDTTTASLSAGAESSSAREPARVTWPLISNKSLIEIGIPAKGEGTALTSRSRSMAFAASIAASTSTWIKAREPSPNLSAILARHSSTSLRALVRPASRSWASEISVGIFGMSWSPCRSTTNIRYRFDLQIEQGRAQRFAMRIQRQRPRHPSSQRPAQDKVESRDLRQLKAHDLAFHDAGKMRFDARSCHLREQQRIMFRVIGNDGDVGYVPLVAGAGMGDLAELQFQPPTNCTRGLANSRGNRTEATATTSRADLKAPPPPAGPLV